MALPILPLFGAVAGLTTLNDWYKKNYGESIGSTIWNFYTGNKNKTKENTNNNTTKPKMQIASAVYRPNDTKAADELAKKLGGGSGSSSSSGGGGVANRIDMTPYINALKEGAAANKKTISDSYAADRNLLSQQLKQYQENTATARRQAMDAYNSARADLEEQSYMNMRAAQQSAASRGLGGSGLQQLAQLSSQIESSNQTSNLSEQNTETQNELTKQLKDQESNINTQISDLINEERNKLTEIDTNTSQAIAQAQYQEEVRYQNALAEAAARNAAIAAQRDSIAGEAALAIENFSGSMDALMIEGINNLTSIFNSSDYVKNQNYSKNNADKLNNSLKTAYEEALSNLTSYYGEAGLGNAGRNYYDYYAQQLRNAYSVLSGNVAR